MIRTFAVAVAAALVVVIAPVCARADSSTELGIFAAVVAGQHVGSDNPIPVNGIVPGGALELEQRVDRIRLHLEGIPTVSAAGSATGPFGRSSASLDLLNSTVLVDVDRNRRVSVGAGFQVINLASSNGTNGDINQARVTSPIYALAARFPIANDRAVETTVMVDPNVRGLLHVFTYAGVYVMDKPEIGAEIDYAAAYRWQRGRFVYRAGVRGLSYHTRNANGGELVDRNVGGGVSFDVRYRLGRR